MTVTSTTWQSLQESASRAQRSGSHEQAIGLYTQALSEPDLPWEARVPLAMARAFSYHMLGDFPAMQAALLELADQAGQRGDDAACASALAELAHVMHNFTGFDSARQVGERALQAAEKSGQPGALVEALCAVCEAESRQLNTTAALEHLEAARALAASAGVRHKLLIQWEEALLESSLSHDSQAYQAAQEGLRLAHQAGDRFLAGLFLNMLNITCRDLARSGKFLEQALENFESLGALVYQNKIRSNMSFLWLTLGLHRRALETARGTLLAGRRLGDTYNGMYQLSNLAILYIELGDFEAAKASLDEIASIAEKLNDRIIILELNHDRVALALNRGDTTAALAFAKAGEFNEGVANVQDQARSLADLAVATLLGGGEPGSAEAARALAQRALGLLSIEDLGSLQIDTAEILWWCCRVLYSAGEPGSAGAADDFRHALDMAQRAVLSLADMSDAGLRRGFLHRGRHRRLIIKEWLKHASGPQLDEFTALVKRPGRLDDIFQRLTKVGVRLNALRDPSLLPDEIVQQVSELTGAERIALVLFDEQGERRTAGLLLPRPACPAMSLQAEPDPDPQVFLSEIEPWLDEAASTRQGFLRLLNQDGSLTEQRSLLAVPLVSRERLGGVVYCDLTGCFGCFEQEDLDLLGILANQSAVALENANWAATLEHRVADRTAELKQSNEQLEQRTGELTIINRVQEGLATRLDFQSIVDLVGDKIREVFNTPDLGISWYEEKTGLVHPLYVYEHGVRLNIPPWKIGEGVILEGMLVTPRPVTWGTPAEVSRVGELIPGTDESKSGVCVPIISGDRVIGTIALENFERENAYSQSDIRLLTTIAASLGTALENARLFEETQRLLKETGERNAELAIINEVQQGLATRLDFQSIVDLVGDKIRQVFNTPDLGISWFDEKAGLAHPLYLYEHGVRLTLPPMPFQPGGLRERMLKTLQPVTWNTAEEGNALSNLVPGTDESKSGVCVPINSSDRMIGSISLENYERENAYSESDIRLLTTIAASLGTALENARLFNETQRLLKETGERNAELAIINEVQQGLATRLDFQSIVDLVGDKLRQVFNTPDLGIAWYEEKTGLVHPIYVYEHGVRLTLPPWKIGDGVILEGMLETHQPVTWGTASEILSVGNLVPGTDQSKSGVSVPIISGDRVIGSISLENYERENAYGESVVRLLTTIAASLGTALENARLFEETQRLLKETGERNAELAIINRVGQALASQLDPQGIYELVGEELQQIFNTRTLTIQTYDRQNNLFHYRYGIENGERFSINPRPPAGFSKHILSTRQPLLIVRDLDQRAAEMGSQVIAGQPPRSYLGVPLIAGGEVTGVISLQNIEREQAFSERDLHLLSTLALNMSVALENARLYQETQRHAVEMASLAEIGSDIASTHDMQPVLERMVTQARSLLMVRDISLYLLQPDGITLQAIVSQGKYVAETMAATVQVGVGITGGVARSGQPEIVNYPENHPGVIHIPGTPQDEDELESMMLAPLISHGQVIGVMSVYRDRSQGLFVQTELDFLVSLARQAAIAIDSARLYAETERRATEMAALANVSRQISATLALPQVLEQIVGQARELLAAGTSAVYLLQPDGQTLKAIAAQGDVASQVMQDDSQLGKGIVGSIVKNGAAEYINDTAADPRQVHIQGTEETSSGEKLIVAPLLVQERAIGALAAWRDPQNAPFNDSELNFASGLAQQVAVAIENARLFEAAQETQRRMADIIEFLPDATLVIDRQGTVIAWNRAMEEMTGVKTAEILGKGGYEYALPFYGERRPILIDLVLLPDEEIETKYAAIHRQGSTLIGEAVVPRLQGRTAYLNATASALRNSRGEVVGAIETIRDITAGKQAEKDLHQAKAEAEAARQQAEAANQAKSAFLAMMSHEIRTPMNAIIGMSSLLMDTPLNPEQRDFAETIRGSGDALLTIINDILDFSKIEAGKMSLEEQPFDLRECVESALDLMKVRASEKGLELAFEMNTDVPPALVGDVTRLRQVLINLLGNSVKFTERGEIVVNIFVEPGGAAAGGPGIPLHFSVRDTGIGIPPDRIGRLFKSFSQVDDSTARKYGGTGLGLALSKRLVELMGGSMWVESEGVPGKGSTFHFSILARPAPELTGRSQLQREQSQLRNRRLLVVDDNATNRRILELQTQAWGMQTRASGLPSEALEWLRRGDPFDLALLDLQMPEMDGVELAGEIRRIESSRAGSPRLPLVLLSSLGGRETARESAEFLSVLSKPLRQSALFDLLMGVFTEQTRQEVPALPARQALDAEMSARHPLRILLAEDNVVNQKVALRLLSQMGYRADLAANGLEVLQAVERQPYDVILMDVQMPEMDGLEASRQLCARIPAPARPRIIAMTANAMQGDREMCLEAGMDDYISKPIRVEELVKALSAAPALATR